MKIPDVYMPYHWPEKHFDAEPNAETAEGVSYHCFAG